MPKPTLAVAEATRRFGVATIALGNALEQYERWLPPTCIISDGPYGLGKFPGEAKTTIDLAAWYAPHAAAWAKLARPDATLWFWNSEVGWATVHSTLEVHGWEYQEAVVWDKGIQHIAGNVNSKTIRGMPVVTEVAVRYVRRLDLPDEHGLLIPAKVWLRAEWQRSGLPLYLSNEATGTTNAATRKYLTQCHLWYFPPGEAVEAMAAYCTAHGRRTARPYFSIDGTMPVTARGWDGLRAKWNHTHGMTNVWTCPPVHNGERIKENGTYVHANQKPLSLMRRQVECCTDAGDVVWEPFGGLCSASLAAVDLDRLAFAAETNPVYHVIACRRMEEHLKARLQDAA
jgi:hypothetical protein